MSVESTVDETILRLNADRWLAHEFLFKHRHTERSSPAHKLAVGILHGTDRRHVLQAFRGFAKSGLTEESIVIEALFREFNNKLIVGSSYDRACERLAAIKREFEQNEDINYFFGNMQGSTWQEGKIVLVSGICIQALGRDQSLRGTKHFDWRPDSWLIDDIEDRETAQTPGGRKKTMDWLLKEFLPALADPVQSRGRVLGTPLDPESLVVELEKMGWPTTKFPIENADEAGKREATWPAKFPLWKIDSIRHDYRRDMASFNQEFMCQAVADSDRVFTREMLRVEPRVRTWQATYAMYDPARTATRTSATTGKAVWSWLGNRLVFWRIDAQLWQPDEIIADIFATNAEFSPTWIGFEKTGLSEWAMQPIRHEAVRRGIVLPLKGIDAPRGKLDFIRGLQPFAAARELIFAEAPDEDVLAQFLSFPTGRIDAPNAAAYALLMRPASPIYDNFGDDNIVEDLNVAPNRPVFLAANATGSMVTAVLLQAFEGQIRILADWVREGSAAEVIADLHMEAAIEGDTSREVVERVRPQNLSDLLKMPEHRVTLARMPVRWVVPPRHAERWNNVGLVQSIRSVPASAQVGGAESAGRDHLRERLSTLSRGAVSFCVSDRATWTLNALAGGYCRAVLRGGGVAEHAEEGVYRVLMEGLESFAGMLARGIVRDDDDDSEQNVSYTRDGVPYKSAMPGRR